MASRKKKGPNENQLGLVIPDAAPKPATMQASKPIVQLIEVPDPPSFNLDELDDYAEDETRLRLVDPPAPLPNVIVELIAPDTFEVSRLRDGGTTVACVRWTRSELEELIRRAQAALRMDL